MVIPEFHPVVGYITPDQPTTGSCAYICDGGEWTNICFTLIDQYGWPGSVVRTITLKKIIGAVLINAGITLIKK